MAGKYSSATTGEGGGSMPSSLNKESISQEFSRLSDVQEAFYFYNGQMPNESDDLYTKRKNLSDTINDSINEVKLSMMNLEEDMSDANYKDYKEMEQTTLDYINAYFSFIKNNPQAYGEGLDDIGNYSSIAFYPEEGRTNPRL